VNGLLDASAMELSRKIRAREVSPVEVVGAHIDRIEAVNPAINAVVAERFEAALAQARHAEAAVMRGHELAPLHGIPFTAKEYIMAEGMPLTAGIWSRRGVRADRSAETVRRLETAGAILVGITNVPEGGLWLETYNDVYGRTLNPWSRARTAGGSSGGEGAIVGAGGVPFGLGADVGGSIRIPAAFCGTVGHKPTGRMVPNSGFWPPCESTELSAYLVIGPLCRRVEDVMPLMRILAGPDGTDTTTRAFELSATHDVPLADVTVYPVERPPGTRVNAANRRAVRRAVDALADRGAQVRELELPRLRKAFMIWSAMMATGGGPAYAEVLGNGKPIAPLRELVRLALRRSRHTLPAVLIVALEELARLLPGQLDRAVAEGRALQAELEALLGPRGVLIYPPYSRPAPRHGSPLLTPFDFVCTALFNVLEFPATVVPIGFDGDGLPLAVQVVGRRGNDHLTVSVAGALESAFGGWKRADP
jgi:fatty acid amide hydrolase 2